MKWPTHLPIVGGGGVTYGIRGNVYPFPARGGYLDLGS